MVIYRRPYSVQPLVDLGAKRALARREGVGAVGGVDEVAKACGCVDHRAPRWRRIVAGGLTWEEADEAATRMGVDPSDLWDFTPEREPMFWHREQALRESVRLRAARANPGTCRSVWLAGKKRAEWFNQIWNDPDLWSISLESAGLS